MPKTPTGPQYLVCNADESEPGSSKDRYLMENGPHTLIEGIIIASYATRATQAWIYVRGEYDRPIQRLLAAIHEAYDAKLVGERVSGSAYRLDIGVYRGHGAYICGEESALLESLEGKRAQPRSRPPYPAVKGAWGRPTTINNVETLCHVPWIIANGSDAFRALGTAAHPGTRLFTVSGLVQRPGNYEAAIGGTYRDLICGLAGGPLPGRNVKAFWPGGGSSDVLPGDMLDLTTDDEAVRAAGSMTGSAGVIVADYSTCMFATTHRLMRFYQHESCGKCTPCRVGTNWAVRTLERIAEGHGTPQDLELLDRIQDGMAGGKSLCGLGDAAASVIRSAMRRFRSEFEDHCLRHECRVSAPVAVH
jgi:NADH-quinone oxidoreductase subunit F